jgi:MFS transporter, DHA1 family, tetracycline resistance protein
MRNISLLGLLTFLLMLSVSMVYPVLRPFVVDRFDTTITQASLFVSVNLLAYVIFAVVWGAMSDKAGTRRPFIITGLLGNSLMMFLVTRADSLPMVLGLRFIEGAFSIMAFSLIMTGALDRVRTVRIGEGIGIVAMSFALGNAFGSPIGGRLGSIDPLLPFYTGAVILLIAAILAFAFLRDAESMSRAGSVRSAVRMLFKEHRLLVPYAFSFVDRFTVGFFVSIFPLYLATVHHAEPATIGLLMFAFLLPFALLQYPGGRLSERTGRAAPIIVGSIAYGICILGIGFLDITAIWFVMIIGGVFGAFMFSPSAALTGDIAPADKRGAAMGGFNFFGSLGFVVGPFVGGLIADTFGFGASFAFAGIAEIVIALIFIPALLRLTRESRIRSMYVVPERDTHRT